MNQSELVELCNCNRTQTFNFRIPQALKKALVDCAQSTGKKPSAIVREAIRNYLFDNKAA
jgi:predicted DNA-binding protein